MSMDIYVKHGEGDRKLQALARKCRLNAEDEARSLSVYQGMIEAIADCVGGRVNRDAPPPIVYVAAYQHGCGVDLSAHASRDGAEARLLSIAWQQCMRDPQIRAAVDARFGPLVSEEPPIEPDLQRPAEGECSDWASPVASEVSFEAHDSRVSALSTSDPDGARGGAEGRSQQEAPHGEYVEERRRTFCEKLLEEWPTLARGELLWIAECSVEHEPEVDIGLGRERENSEETEFDGDERAC